MHIKETRPTCGMEAFGRLSFHFPALQRGRTRESAELPLPSVKKVGQAAGGRAKNMYELRSRCKCYCTYQQSCIDEMFEKATLSPCILIVQQPRSHGFTKRRLETRMGASTRTKKSAWTLPPATN